jgi:alpha-tubulin suppressor-like RCC1 family protein
MSNLAKKRLGLVKTRSGGTDTRVTTFQRHVAPCLLKRLTKAAGALLILAAGPTTPTFFTTGNAFALSASGATLAAASFSSYAVDSTGNLWAWGDNSRGELGNGTWNNHNATPQKVSGLSGVIAVAGGNASALALEVNGTVWEFGDISASNPTCSCDPKSRYGARFGWNHPNRPQR